MGTQYPPRIQTTFNDFSAGDTYVLSDYVAGDFDGTFWGHSFFESDTPGSPATLDLSLIGDLVLNYADFTDIHVVNGTIVTRGGVDGGGNDGITFSAVPSGGGASPSYFVTPQTLLSILRQEEDDEE
jgi:hypothetical protein